MTIQCENRNAADAPWYDEEARTYPVIQRHCDEAHAALEAAHQALTLLAADGVEMLGDEEIVYLREGLLDAMKGAKELASNGGDYDEYRAACADRARARMIALRAAADAIAAKEAAE